MKKFKLGLMLLLMFTASGYAAQFTLNVPVNTQFFSPEATFNVACDLYRQDEDVAAVSESKTIPFGASGAYTGVVQVEFDQVAQPENISHYSCLLSFPSILDPDWDGSTATDWSASGIAPVRTGKLPI